MNTVTLPSLPGRTEDRDAYGFARLPSNAHDAAPERIDRVPYGRFRNVYLYITERCQLRCEHCYMGERLDRALKMPFDQITATLRTWRQMGGSKLRKLRLISSVRLGVLRWGGWCSSSSRGTRGG
jgi:hypothetical protein